MKTATQTPEVTPVKKGDSITIIGRRWFDKINGNTYHSCECLVNGEVVGYVPFAYGYGEQYIHSGMKKLEELGYVARYEGSPFNSRYDLETMGVKFHATHSDVSRKKDL